MANYKIFLKPSAVKELGKISGKTLQKIVEKIENLATNPRPRGYEKLSNEKSYRIRQGNYRILYTIEDDRLIVMVIKIGHRGDVYQRLK